MKAIMSRIAAISFGITLISVSACSDKSAKPAADSSLARDLALAGSQAAQPQFQDTAVGPAPQQAGRSAEAPPAPVKTRVAAKPVAQLPRPTPSAAQQQPAPTTTAPAPAAAPAAAPAVAHAEIASGTGIAMTSGSKICSTSLPGEKFVATVNSAISGSNGAEIPAGSTVVLEVASANNGENADGAQMTFRVRAVVVGDKTYTVNGEVHPEATLVKGKVQGVDPNADKKKVVGGAIAGAILGQMIGHNTKGTVIGAAAGAAAGATAAKMGERWEACLPSGASLRLTLSAPLTMS